MRKLSSYCVTSLTRLSSIDCVESLKWFPINESSRHLSTSNACCKQTNNNNSGVKTEKTDVKDTIVTFQHLRNEVLEELKNKEIAGVKWKRFPKLNKILKGHRRGELTVLTGRTGCGKTTFLSEYSMDLCEEGVKTLWGNFELKNVRLMKLMLNQFARLSLDENLELFDTYADEFEKLKMYYMKFHGCQSFKTVLETMKYAVAEFNVEHIIIDNLQFMIGNRVSALDRFAYQDSVVGLCRSFATDTNTHVTVVIHPRKEQTEELNMNSIFGGGKATQEADNVLIIQQLIRSIGDKKLSYRKYLEIAKNRYDGHLGTIQLFYNHSKHGFGYNPEDDRKVKQTLTTASSYPKANDGTHLIT